MTRGLVTIAGLLLVAVGCSPSTSPTPTPTPSISSSAEPSTGSFAPASPSGSIGPITSAEAAAAAVLATDPRFGGIRPKDPNLIGACCFWEVAESVDGWTVTIEIGWGDCPAGCIDRHRWTYAVTKSGSITLESETGPSLPPGVPGGFGGDGGSAVPGIGGTALAGPACPLVQPNDSACPDRPVAGATIHILDEAGTEVAQLETDPTGAFRVTLPPGRYRVFGDAVEGLIGTPPAVDVEVGTTLAIIQIRYDTGIR